MSSSGQFLCLCFMTVMIPTVMIPTVMIPTVDSYSQLLLIPTVTAYCCGLLYIRFAPGGLCGRRLS